MTDFNYKEYSLSKLSEWIHDCISSGESSPHEIYSTIRNAVHEDYNVYKEREKNCLGLLELLSGHRPINLADDWEQHYYPEEYGWTMKEALKESQYYDPTIPPWGNIDMKEINNNTSDFDAAGNDVSDLVNDSPTKWILSVEVDGASGEYYMQLPDDLLDSLGWKEGDTLEYVDNKDGSFRVKKTETELKKSYTEMIANGYTMTADGFWIKE